MPGNLLKKGNDEMLDNDDKNKPEDFAAMGCFGVWIIIQLGIPILLFVVLLMAVCRGCARIFN